MAAGSGGTGKKVRVSKLAFGYISLARGLARGPFVGPGCGPLTDIALNRNPTKYAY